MTKVNVGDTVKCGASCYSSIKKGEICIVTEVLSATKFKGKKTASGGHYNNKDFALVSRAKPLKFKVGDVIRCTTNNYGAVNKGCETICTGIDKDGDMQIKEGLGGDHRFLYEMEQFELVEKKSQYKFKKGDQVTPVHDFMGIDSGQGVALSYAESDGVKFGRVYTIHSADNSIVLKNQGSGLYLNPLQFRLATETEVIAEELDLNVPCAEEAPLPVQEDTDMYPETVTTGTPAELKVETISYVNGKPIANYSVEQQASLIMDVENRITALKGIKAKSKAINAEIAKFQAFLKDAVALFDSLIAD